MAISIGFSYVIYITSTHEVGSGLRRQFAVIQQSPFRGSPSDSFESFRMDQINQASQHLRMQLLLLNLLVLTGGGVFSYWLARRHLEPLEQAMAAQARFTSDAAN